MRWETAYFSTLVCEFLQLFYLSYLGSSFLEMLSKVGFQQAVKRATSRKLSTYPAYIVNAPLTEVSKTKNGVRVASETAPGETATVSVFIDSGSRYEHEKTNGVSYMLDHMAFTGCKKTAAAIESVGGIFNVSTSREQTVLTAKVFKNDVPKAMEILAGAMQCTHVDDAAINREKNVILAKAAAFGKNNEKSIFEHLHETAFMGTALGQPVVGTESNIKSLTKADLLTFIAAHYSADRVVVAGAGAVDHKQLAELSEKHLGKLSAAASGGLTKFDPAVFVGSDKRIRFDSMGEAHIALAFEGASASSEYAFPLMLMQTILGSWSKSGPLGLNAASKLAREVAEHELAHSFTAFNLNYKDTGLFGIYLKCPDNKLDDAMWYTLDNLVRLCHNVSDEEVARAKTQLKTNMLVSSPTAIANDIGRQMLAYGRVMSPAEIATRIDAITTADVKGTANKFINDEDHALAAIGPIFELPDYNWIRRRSYWHRY